VEVAIVEKAASAWGRVNVEGLDKACEADVESAALPLAL
jgi:hypothetical protein